MGRAVLKLVTIVAEPVLEHRILSDLKRLGSRGWSLVDGRGEGSRGRRVGEIPGVHVRIETVVEPGTAERILEHVAEHYFAHYAVVAFVADVEVVRGEKYVG